MAAGLGSLPKRGWIWPNSRRWEMLTAHCASCVLHFGAIPGGQHTLHKCDNPACVNPRHLFLGAHTDNMRNCIQKGRKAYTRGESSGHAKLSAEDLVLIRELPLSQLKLAALFGVNPENIFQIKHRKTWRHIP
jgi:hypothetical protein